jgi:hypothetical protein
MGFRFRAARTVKIDHIARRNRLGDLIVLDRDVRVLVRVKEDDSMGAEGDFDTKLPEYFPPLVIEV